MLFMHVGLHKTGTTFLQQHVFPRWRDLVFIPAALEHLVRMDERKTNLVSREGLSGRFWDPHERRDVALKRLSELFPEARILMSFRQHEGYIVSAYKQYIQIGGTIEFREFFDLEHDRGVMKRDDFLFQRKIASIEKHFGHTPFVFLHEEVSRGLATLMRDMATLFGVPAPSLDEIRIRHLNKSVGYYPLKLLRRLNRLNRSEFNPGGRFRLDTRFTRALRIDPRHICQHWLSVVPDRSLLEATHLAAIREYYSADWAAVQSAVEARVGSPGRRPA